LVLIGRRCDRLKNLKESINSKYPAIAIHTEAISVSDIESVASLPTRLPLSFQNVDILVNNAGLALGGAVYNRYQLT